LGDGTFDYQAADGGQPGGIPLDQLVAALGAGPAAQPALAFRCLRITACRCCTRKFGDAASSMPASGPDRCASGCGDPAHTLRVRALSEPGAQSHSGWRRRRPLPSSPHAPCRGALAMASAEEQLELQPCEISFAAATAPALPLDDIELEILPQRRKTCTLMLRLPAQPAATHARHRQPPGF